jgi:hypothetical protein
VKAIRSSVYERRCTMQAHDKPHDELLLMNRKSNWNRTELLTDRFLRGLTQRIGRLFSANRNLHRACPRAAVREPDHCISPQLFPARNNPIVRWFVIGEKENRERSPAETACAERYCTKLKCVSKPLIINRDIGGGDGSRTFHPH